MSSIHIAEPAIQAINILANNAVSKAGFDKTIKATVKELVDKPTGTYKIKYQDSEFQAYAGSSNVYYKEGQQVSVLVPGGDWDRPKLIVGARPGSALVYKQVPVTEEQYNSLGPNALTLKSEIELHSELGEQMILLYSAESSEESLLQATDISKYIKAGNSIAFRIVVRTDFGSHLTGGRYGVLFNLHFKDSTTGEEVIKSYTVSDRELFGNPYELKKAVPINALVSNLDTENFIKIDSIYAYCEGFPQTKSSIEETTPDIFISEIGISGAESLTLDELDGYILHINVPEGDAIEKGREEDLPLQAQLKVKGQHITDKIKYYWFVEDGMIFRNTQGYSSYGGQGWRCLNPPQGITGHLFVPFENPYFYLTGSETNQIQKYNPQLKVTKFLCVAWYNDSVAIKSECKIINENIDLDIFIDSSDKKDGQNKTEYFLGNGHPTFTCKIKDLNSKGDLEEITEEDYKKYNFTWSIQPANGKATIQNQTFTPFKKSQDSDEYYSYTEAEEIYNEYLNQLTLSDGSEAAAEAITVPFKDEEGNDLWLEERNKEYIDGNRYINFPINSITNYTKIICAVTDEDGNYKGSTGITIYNKMSLEGQYSLTINNGSQIFQYNEKGNSPFVAEEDRKPMEKIPPLGFTLLDGSGSQISYNQILEYGSIRWLFPKDNTLLLTDQKGQETDPGTLILDSTDKALSADYHIFKNRPTFSYFIEDRYSLNKTNNNIGLVIKFKDFTFETWTDFTFPKNGDPGTNGTNLIAKIIPQDDNENNLSTDRVYAMKKGNDDVFFTDTGGRVDKLGFFVYNNNEVIYSNADFWSCPPKAIYDNQNQATGNTFLSYNLTGEERKLGLKNLSNHEEDIDKIESFAPINIIRGQYGKGNDDVTKYYAEYPICYQHINNSSNYRIKIKPKTGFKYVIYAEDGTRPDYDNAKPFEIIVERNIGSYFTRYDISDIQCEWDTIGSIQKDEEKSIGLPSNQKYFKPANEFNGLNLTTAIVVKVSAKDGQAENKNLQEIGYIHIPIYMNLNRYGNNAINGWDGNSIDLGKNNSTILAPQVGAGKKDSDTNTFTGVLIGQQKTGEEEPQTGLFGYYKGQRSIFLDAQSGKAEFGKQGAAKIILDPSQQMNEKDVAFIYSNNFDKESYKENNGALKSGSTYINYQKRNDQGKPNGQGGMMIDLTTPQIAFANGKFNVSGAGALHSEYGDIAGWIITPDKLYKNETGMSSGNNSVIRPNENAGGPNSTVTDTKAFYAGTSNSKDNFYVTHSGYLYSKFGQIAGWNIGEKTLIKKYISGSGTDASTITIGMNADPNNTAYKISSTAKWPDGQPSTYHKAKAFFANGDKFYVTHDGYLRSTSGTIATWNINSNYLSNSHTGLGHKVFDNTTGGKNAFNTSITARFWSGTDDSNKGLNFAVDNEGNLYSKAGKIGGWNINETMLWAGSTNPASTGIRLSSNGDISGGGANSTSHWSISGNGYAQFNNINASGGKIGNWNITSGAIENGNVKLTSDGTIDAKAGYIGATTIDASGLHGKGWDITNTFAKFTGLQVNSDGKVQSSSTGGIHGGSSGSSYNWPGGSTKPTMEYDKKSYTPDTVKVWDVLRLQLATAANDKISPGLVGKQSSIASEISGSNFGLSGGSNAISTTTINGVTVVTGINWDNVSITGNATITDEGTYGLNTVLYTDQVCVGWGTCTKQEVGIFSSLYKDVTSGLGDGDD